MPLPSGGRGAPGSAGLHWLSAPSCQPLGTQRGWGKAGMKGQGLDSRGMWGPAAVEVDWPPRMEQPRQAPTSSCVRHPWPGRILEPRPSPFAPHALSCILLGCHLLCTQLPPSLQPLVSPLVRHHPAPPTPSALAPGWGPRAPGGQAGPVSHSHATRSRTWVSALTALKS